MRIMFKAFARKLFGAGYKRAKRTLLANLIVFWSLHAAGFRIHIAPFVLYLMVSTLTAGVMWQALSSDDNAANMKNLFMLPFEGRELILSYVSAMGAYTFLTGTAGLLAVVLAVSRPGGIEILGSILCTVNAVLMTACIYSRRKYRSIGFIWAGAGIAAIYLLWDSVVFIPLLAGNILFTLLFLSGTDAYSFYRTDSRKTRTVGRNGHYSICRYLLRYLTAHRNYLINTAAMWGVGCALPVFLGPMKGISVMPVGFAILSLNTPVCILLSCDPDLERAVRFLPGQIRAFCLPYCLFVFLCNLSADLVFLCSWYIQIGSVDGMMILAGTLIALLSAAGSVLLEWFFPVRGWKIESDLLHHPRKYIVPVVMLLAAVFISSRG